MIRKLSTVILTLVLLLGCADCCLGKSVVYAAEKPDGIAYALNIVKETDTDKTLTRGEAAGIAVRLTGYDGGGFEGGAVFEDVSENDANACEIYAAYMLGIISMPDDGMFEPKKSVTYTQFVKMVVEALGYGERAVQLGGYPIGYCMVAAELKLDKNIEIGDGEKVLVNTAAVIAENALNVKLPEKRNINEGKDMTLLEKSFRLEKYTGIVTGAYGTAYTPYSKAARNGEVYINDVLYLKGESNIDTMVGYEAEFYIEKNDDEPCTVVYAKKKACAEVVIDPGNITEVVTGRNEMRISYYPDADSRRVTTEKLDFAVTKLVYNGFYADITKFDKDLFDFNDGSVRLIDSDKDSVWDYVAVDRVTTAAVKNYSESSDRIGFNYDIEMNGKEVNALDLTEYEVIFSDGSGFDTIASGSVIEMYIPFNGSGSKKTLKMRVSNTVVSGKLSEKSEEDGKNYLVIDGESYELSDDYIKAAAGIWDSLLAGSEYTLYLTSSGKAAYIDDHTGEKRVFGYLTDLAVSKSVDGVYSMKVYMDDGKFHYLDFADKVKVFRDGANEGVKPAAEALGGLLANGTFDKANAQLIRFLPNRDSKVTVIEFAQNEVSAPVSSELKGRFVKTHSKFDGYYFHFPRMVYRDGNGGAVFPIPNSTICFTVPSAVSDLDDEKSFSTGTYTGGRGAITAESYNIGDDGVPEIVVVYGSVDMHGGYDYKSNGIIVKSVGSAIDEDGSTCPVMTDINGNMYYSDTDENVFTDMSTGKSFKFGDVVQIGIQNGNYAKFADIIFFRDDAAPNGYGYTYTDPEAHVRNTSDGIVANGGIDWDRIVASGYVEAVSDSYIMLKNKAGNTEMFAHRGLQTKLTTVYPKNKTVAEETIDKLTKGDFVVIKCEQSILTQAIRYIQ